MAYYGYLFYKLYCFFFRLNPHDTPGIKATLLLDFVLLANGLLLLSAGMSGLGYEPAQSIHTSPALVVAAQLGIWGANYWLFWRGGRLPAVLRQYEEGAVSLNKPLARALAVLFYLVPSALFVGMAIRGA